MTIQLTPLPGAEVRVVMQGDDTPEITRLIAQYAGDEVEFYRINNHAVAGTTDIITASTWVRRVLSLEAVR